MKKIVWFSLSVFLFLFGISHVKAATLLSLLEASNGNISTSLNFEEGYVGGIDVTLKVSGNVSLSSISWDSSITSNYTKKYSYDNTNQTIRIIITTGNQTRNLANKDGVVSIGTLVFNGNDKTDYTIDITSLTYIDANYISKIKTDYAINSDNSFIYDTNKTTPPTPSEPENPSNPNTPSDNNSNTNNNSSNNNSSTTTGNQNTGNNEAEENNENSDLVEGNENESNENTDDKKKPSNNNDNSSKPKEDEKEEKSTVKKESSLMSFLKIAILVLLGLSIIGILIKIIKK